MAQPAVKPAGAVHRISRTGCLNIRGSHGFATLATPTDEKQTVVPYFRSKFPKAHLETAITAAVAFASVVTGIAGAAVALSGQALHWLVRHPLEFMVAAHFLA
jgi:hypothetical protein